MDCICISHRGANADSANLSCRTETRLSLPGVEPGQDTLSRTREQQGAVGGGGSGWGQSPDCLHVWLRVAEWRSLAQVG